MLSSIKMEECMETDRQKYKTGRQNTALRSPGIQHQAVWVV